MDFFNFLDDFWDVVGDDVLDRLKDVLEYIVNKLLDIFEESSPGWFENKNIKIQITITILSE